MSARIKTVLITVVCTTAGWVVLLAVVFWCSGRPLDVGFVPFEDTLTGRDYCGVLLATNPGQQSITLFIDGISSNHTWTTGGPVLLQREVPPGGYVQFGFRRMRVDHDK
jgi:hypothetical protein